MISISLEVHFIFRPPSGCLQYLFGNRVGTFETFNFASGSGHLVNQNYAVCIRQEFGRYLLRCCCCSFMTKSNKSLHFSGYCCVQYRICDASGAFSLDTNAPQATGTSKIETGCTGDFIQIEGNFKNSSNNQFFATLSSWLLLFGIFLFHLIG